VKFLVEKKKEALVAPYQFAIQIRKCGHTLVPTGRSGFARLAGVPKLYQLPQCLLS